MVLTRNVLLAIGGVLVLGIALTLWATRETRPEPDPLLLTIGPETTVIKAPLLKDGYPDYLAALDERNAAKIPPELNVAATIFRLCGRGELNERQTVELCRKLGIPTLPKEGPYFQGWHEYLKTVPEREFPAANDREVEIRDLIARTRAIHERVAEFRDIGLAGPWRRDDYPLLGVWIDAQKPTLDQILALTDDALFAAPHVCESRAPLLFTVLHPHVQHLRSLCFTLIVRANEALQRDDRAAAWRDLRAAYKLIGCCYQGPFLVDQLVGASCERKLQPALHALLHSSSDRARITPEQYAELERDFLAVRRPPQVRRAIELGERFMYLDIVSSIAQYGVEYQKDLHGETPPTPVAYRQRAAFEYDTLLTEGNELYTELAELWAIDDPVERRVASESYRERLAEEADSIEGLTSWGLMQQNKRNRSFGLRKILTSRLLPPTTMLAISIDERQRMLFELDRASFTLARYRAEHGRYPERLEELSPIDFHAIPNDYALPSRWSIVPTGAGFLLYSVGDNGRDDNGQGGEIDEDDTDDLAIYSPDHVPTVKE